MLCYKNKCFDELFNKFLLNNSKKVITSSNNVNVCYGGTSNNRITVYFYEWSDINRSPRYFYNVDSFIKFLNDCKISYTSYQYNRLHESRWFYCSCVKGESKLILCESYLGLRERLKFC